MNHLTSPPPFEIVQLSTLPQDRWKGMPVFHPCFQDADSPKWVEDRDPGWMQREGIKGNVQALYDVGVVLRWEPDPDFADLGAIRVHFIGSHGSMLHYDATNLWVPKDVLP